MTRDEAKKIVMIIVSTYPSFKPLDMSMTVDSWYFFLADYEYNKIAIALKSFVATSGSSFAPSPSELIAMANKSIEYNQLTDSEAWDMVNKAIRNSTYHAEEEYEKLPDLVKKCVGSPSQLRSWGQTDVRTLDSVVASNFMRTYRTQADREREYKMLPPEARQLIGGVNEQLRLQQL